MRGCVANSDRLIREHVSRGVRHEAKSASSFSEPTMGSRRRTHTRADSGSRAVAGAVSDSLQLAGYDEPKEKYLDGSVCRRSSRVRRRRHEVTP
ncbi:hypothetical protein EVAR_36881_1 [Eumeta japonica]|uniref:Uncharacterized protein n=1 Tax=Eumeta variegata TaxID=151549 RepID=A0A4C1WRI8_EUMVA|nr:hypothetical protein EVAR_36881_1 [Eumeta japonica]